MKKIIKIFPSLVLLIMTILTFSLVDMSEKERYKTITDYNSVGFVIPENNDNIKNDDIDMIFNIAKEHGIILVKTVYNETNDSIDNYITTDDILGLMNKQLEIDTVDSHNIKGITTYSDDCCLYYRDFLRNDRYSFYSSDLMKENEVYRYGSYLLYYNSDGSYIEFIDEIQEKLNVPFEELQSEFLGQLSEPIDVFYMLTFICLFFFALFYFILVVFLFYRNSKKIGVLTLLGFTNKDILKLNLKEDAHFIIAISSILLLLSYVLVPNISFSVLIILACAYLFIFILSIIISCLALLFLQRFFSVSNILKQQSIIRKISNICLFGKFMMIASMILITINYLPLINESVEARNILKENEVLMDYALFPRIRLDNSEYDDYDKFLAFYKALEKSEIEYIYVDFGGYLEKEAEVIENFNLSEANGDSYRIASVDHNYLNLYDLQIVDINGNQINIEDIHQEFYLLPQSKEMFKEGLGKYIQKKYQRYNIDDDVLIYFYEDLTFDTFDSQKGIKVVQSPIIRVISTNNPFTYFENSYGIDVAGTGMNTALKFNVSNENHFFGQKLYKYIKSSGLENVLIEDNFVRYTDYYNELITRVHNTNTIFISSISFCLIIYVFMIVQTFILFIDARKNEILVKSLMGYKRKHIFDSVISWNIGATIIPISCICAYSFASGSKDLPLIVFVCLLFFVIDLIMIFMIGSNIKLDRVYQGLKGE